MKLLWPRGGWNTLLMVWAIREQRGPKREIVLQIALGAFTGVGHWFQVHTGSSRTPSPWVICLRVLPLRQADPTLRQWKGSPCV